MTLNDEQQGVLNLFGETLFYGFFCILESIIIYVLISYKGLSLSYKLLLLTSVVQFILETIHMGSTLYATFVNDLPVSQVAQMQMILSMLLALLGDYILIWRVWIVWSRQWWIIVVPFFLSTTSFVIGIIGAVGLNSNHGAFTFFSFIPVSALLVASTGLNTFLIVARLTYQRWHTKRVLRNEYPASIGESYITRAMLLVLESGAIMISALLIGLILEKCNNPGAYVVLNWQTPLMGLVPASVIILVHFNVAIGNRTTEQYEQRFTTMRFGENQDLDMRSTFVEDIIHSTDKPVRLPSSRSDSV